MISGKARAHRTSAQVVACSFKMVRVTGSGKFTKAVSKKLHVEDAEDKDEADSDKEEETVKEVVKPVKGDDWVVDFLRGFIL